MLLQYSIFMVMQIKILVVVVVVVVTQVFYSLIIFYLKVSLENCSSSCNNVERVFST